MMITLAAAIPTHNRHSDVLAAVESVINQGVDMEVIVVDDGSDPPLDAVSLPPHVNLIRNDAAAGPAQARNAAADAATAEWIAFLDDDDRWLAGKAEAVIKAIDRFRDAQVVFHRTGYRANKGTTDARRIATPLNRVLRHQPPHLSGVIVRRVLHQEIRFDESLWAAEDLDYLIRLAQAGVWVEIPDILSVHATSSAGETAIGLHTRIAGRLSLFDRHGDLIQKDRVAHSFFHARLGHLYRRADQKRDARASFLRALKIRPTSKVALSGLLRLYLPISNRPQK